MIYNKTELRRLYAFYRKGNSLRETVAEATRLFGKTVSISTLSTYFKEAGLQVRLVGAPSLEGLSKLPAAARQKWSKL